MTQMFDFVRLVVGYGMLFVILLLFACIVAAIFRRIAINLKATDPLNAQIEKDDPSKSPLEQFTKR